MYHGAIIEEGEGAPDAEKGQFANGDTFISVHRQAANHGN
jgi:hypothetical protein